MRSFILTAIKVGAAGAILLLSLFIVVSFGINYALYAYLHYHSWLADEAGSFLIILLVFSFIVMTIVLGPISVSAAHCDDESNIVVVGVAFITYMTFILLSFILISAYMLFLSVIGVNPYFFNMVIY